MFKIALSPTFPARVEVEFQGGGRAHFEGVFRRLDQTELDRMSAGIESGEIRDAEIVDRVLEDWRGVEDEQGVPIACDAAGRAKVLNVPGVRAAIVRAFFDSFPKARAKN